MEKIIQGYVPGFHIALGPILENGRVTLSVEVTGGGDYLPKYAGNLDIITCAAVKIAQEGLRKQWGWKELRFLTRPSAMAAMP